MATKSFDELKRAAEGAAPESVNAATTFLLATSHDTLHQVLAAQTLRWFAMHVETLDLGQVREALAAPGYEAIFPLLEQSVLEDARKSPIAQAKLRGIRRKKELLEAEGGALSTAEAAELLGGITKQAVDKRRARRKILALPTGGGEYAFPLWQFDENSRDGLVPGLAQVLENFSIENPWMQAEFLLAPNTRLGGKRPLDALRAGEVDAVAHATSTYGEHGAE